MLWFPDRAVRYRIGERRREHAEMMEVSVIRAQGEKKFFRGKRTRTITEEVIEF
jgi:hypothetical protein